GEEVDRRNGSVRVELDLPGVVEDVAAEGPENRQRVAAHRVGRLAADDVSVEIRGIVRFRVGEHVSPAGRRGRLVAAIHEHLDVSDDSDAVEMLRFALLARRYRTVRWGPGAHVIDHRWNVRVARKAKVRVERLERAPRA